MPTPEPSVRVTSYEVTCLPPDHIDAHSFTVKVEYRGRDKWAVMDGPFAFDVEGVKDWEPSPSNREDDWLETHRFDLDTALEIAKKVAPLLSVNGWTVEKVLADIAAREADALGRERTDD